MSGGLAGGLLDPFVLATGLVPMAMLGKMSALRRTVLTARAAEKTMASRGKLAAATALDGMVAEGLYGAMQMASRNTLTDKFYGWDDLINSLVFGAGIGGALGGAFPNKLSTMTLLVEDHNFLAAANSVRKNLGEKGYNHFMKFFKAQEGAINLDLVGKIFRGVENKTAKSKGTVIARMEKIKTLLADGDAPAEILGVPRTQQFKPKFKNLMEVRGNKLSRFLDVTQDREALGESRLALEYAKENWIDLVQDVGDVGHNVDNYISQVNNTGKIYGYTANTLYTALPTSLVYSYAKVRDGLPVASSVDDLITMVKNSPNYVNNQEQLTIMQINLGHNTTLFDLSAKHMEQYFFDKYGILPGTLHTKPKVLQETILKEGWGGAGIFWMDGSKANFRGYLSNLGRTSIGSVSENVRTVDLKKITKKATQEEIQSFMDHLEGKKGVPPAVTNIRNLFYSGLADNERKVIDRYFSLSHEAVVREAPGDAFLLKRVGETYHQYPLTLTLEKLGYTPPLDQATTLGARLANLLTEYQMEFDVTTTLDDILKMAKSGPEGLFEQALTNELGKLGYTLDVRYNLDRPPPTWSPLGSELAKEKKTLKQVLFDGNLPSNFENTPISKALVNQSLRLDKHPSTMTFDEVLLAKELTRLDPNPIFKTVDNTTNYIGAPIGQLLTPEVSQSLASLGYTSVKYMSGGKELEYSITPTDLPKTMGDYAKVYGRLKEAINQTGKAVDETATASEKKKYFDTMYDNALKQGMYYKNLVNDLLTQIPQDRVETSGLNRLLTDYSEVVEELGTAALGSTTHQNLLAKKLGIEHGVERIHQVAKLVEYGGLLHPDATKFMGKKLANPSYNAFLEGQELLVMLKSQPEHIFNTLGGINLETMQKTMYNEMITNLVVGVKEIGGDALFNRFMRGDLDHELLKIKHQKDRLRREQAGDAGQMTQKKGVIEGVTDSALKVFNAITSVTRYSQKMLVDAGFHRPPQNDYIGYRGYDSSVISKTPFEEFARDFKDAAINLQKDEELRELYSSFISSSTKSPDPNTAIFNTESTLRSQRKIVYKDADREFKILQKYGNATKLGSKIKLLSDLIQPNSNIAIGLFNSLATDSNLSAVTSIFGTYPYLALNVAHEVLDTKMSKAVIDKQITEAMGQSLSTKLSRTKVFSANVLDAYVVPEIPGTGKWAKSAQVLKSGTLIKTLPLVAMHGVFTDPMMTAMHLERLNNTGKRGITGLIKNLYGRFGRAIPGWSSLPFKGAETRKKLGNLLNVVLSTESREYTKRYIDSPTGWASWIASTGMRMTFAPAITDRNRVGSTTLFSMGFAERLKQPWNTMEGRLQNRLKTYGLNEQIWEAVRQTPDAIVDHQGIKLLAPFELKTALSQKLGTEQATNITRMFDAAITDMVTWSMPEATKYSSQFFKMARGHDPEGVWDNAFQLTQMYRSVALESWLALKAGIKELEGKGIRSSMRDAEGVGAVMSMLFVGGLFQAWARDLASGKYPQDPFASGEATVDLVSRAVMYSGLAGIGGDFLLNSTSGRYGFMNFFVGPAISGGLYTVAGELPSTILNPSKAPEMAGKLVKLLGESTANGPIQQLILNTAFLNSLGSLGSLWYDNSDIARKRGRYNKLGKEFIFDR